MSQYEGSDYTAKSLLLFVKRVELVISENINANVDDLLLRLIFHEYLNSDIVAILEKAHFQHVKDRRVFNLHTPIQKT